MPVFRRRWRRWRTGSLEISDHLGRTHRCDTGLDGLGILATQSPSRREAVIARRESDLFSARGHYLPLRDRPPPHLRRRDLVFLGTLLALPVYGSSWTRSSSCARITGDTASRCVRRLSPRSACPGIACPDSAGRGSIEPRGFRPPGPGVVRRIVMVEQARYERFSNLVDDVPRSPKE
jgi:hypothetical protein